MSRSRNGESDRTQDESYERLYRLWEESGWSATSIDLDIDATQWRKKLSRSQREAAQWNYSMFLAGVEGVAKTCTTLLTSNPGRSESNLLATQVSDEVRSRVFFERFLREVTGQGWDAESTREAAERHLTWGFRQVFAELDKLMEALKKKPKDKTLLAQNVALCHVIIEGVLAIPGQHFIQRYIERQDVLPGLTEGLRNIARDEARHVAFGSRLLRDLVSSSKECRSAAIETFNRVLPWMVGVFVPPGMNAAYMECYDFSLEDVYVFGLKSLETRIERIGIEPRDVTLLSLDDRSLSYEERASRLLVLIRDGVIGDDRREPKLTPRSFEILFEGTERALDMETATSLGGPVEWDFTDADPWHLVVTNGEAEAKPGRAGTPALRLEIASGDWAKIAIGRSDSRWALLTRKLRVHGHLPAKAKLAKLFN
jgi:Ribonucleotide reductase, small chain/SCP-2 sterol transfer family